MVTVPSTFTLVYTFLTPNLGKVFQFDGYFSQLGGSTSKRNLANQVIDRGDGKGGRWSRLQICPPYSLGNYPPQLVPVPRDLNIGETREPGGLIQGQIYQTLMVVRRKVIQKAWESTVRYSTICEIF